MVLSLDQALGAHLAIPAAPPVNGVQYKSSLTALLTDARGAAQRDLITGRPTPGGQHHSWLAATAYLILLDQIGTCFQVAGTPGTNGRPLIHALRAFSSEQDQRVQYALYALRCALAHDYALFNNRPEPYLRHAFNFLASPALPLIRFPTRTWSGKYDVENLPPRGEITVINLHKLADLVEGVVTELHRQRAADQLELRPGLTVDEFHLRYGLVYRVS